MDSVTKSQFGIEQEKFVHLVKNKSSVFIHPTDTIYGLGCNATDDEAVTRLRKIKDRYTRPFSVIAPSKEWILENCVVEEKEKAYLDKLPGPYTLVFNLKNKECIHPLTNNNQDTIGVRIPDHWISSFVEKMGVPMITTSANKLGEDFMTSIEDLDPRIKGRVDFMVYEGEKQGRPSKVFNLAHEDIEVIHR